MKVLTVNNFRNHVGRGWIRMLEESLAATGVSAESIGWNECSSGKFDGYDGIVLSGSQAMASKEGTLDIFSRELEAVKNTSVPLLGICFGHQLLSRAFGSQVTRGARPTAQFVETEVVARDPIFDGLRRRISVYESHYEIVESVPADFKLLARSPSSPVGAVKHNRLPLYGVQFHPERNSSLHPDGARVLANFVRSLA